MINNFLRKGAAAVLSVLLTCPPGLVCAASAEEPVSVQGLEVGPDRVRVRVSSKAQFDSFVTSNPPRLVLQIEGAEYVSQTKSLSGKGKYLKGITTSSTMGPGVKINPEAKAER